MSIKDEFQEIEKKVHELEELLKSLGTSIFKDVPEIDHSSCDHAPDGDYSGPESDDRDR